MTYWRRGAVWTNRYTRRATQRLKSAPELPSDCRAIIAAPPGQIWLRLPQCASAVGEYVDMGDHDGLMLLSRGGIIPTALRRQQGNGKKLKRQGR